jgi:hypothetical protein
MSRDSSTRYTTTDSAPSAPALKDSPGAKCSGTKNLKQYPSKGKMYRYHRPSRVRITAQPGTVEFDEQMAAAEARHHGRRQSL